jgi:PhnB protein
MTTRLNPYISFRDNAREAMEFYHSVFGGKLDVNTFKQFGASHGPEDDDKIMHSMLEAPNGMVLMGADTPKDMELSATSNISISLSGEGESELRGYFEKLLAGGTPIVPMEKAPWGDIFGMCTDKFGVTWLVNVTAASS